MHVLQAKKQASTDSFNTLRVHGAQLQTCPMQDPRLAISQHGHSQHMGQLSNPKSCRQCLEGPQQLLCEPGSDNVASSVSMSSEHPDKQYPMLSPTRPTPAAHLMTGSDPMQPSRPMLDTSHYCAPSAACCTASQESSRSMSRPKHGIRCMVNAPFTLGTHSAQLQRDLTAQGEQIMQARAKELQHWQQQQSRASVPVQSANGVACPAPMSELRQSPACAQDMLKHTMWWNQNKALLSSDSLMQAFSVEPDTGEDALDVAPRPSKMTKTTHDAFQQMHMQCISEHAKADKGWPPLPRVSAVVINAV